MKTLLILNTGNDADIVKESLLHNERFFDKIVVMDRDSADNTVHEIESLNNPKIHIIHADKYLPYLQPMINQAIWSEAMREFDFVIILDADEFIVAENLQELNTIPENFVGVIKWNCYVPEKNVYRDFKSNITTRRTLEPAGGHKVVVPRKTNCFLTLGNHYAHDSLGKRIPHVEMATIKIAHFPVRSIEQYNKKIDFFNSENLINIQPGQLTHLIHTPKINTIAELQDKAMNYIETLPNQSLVHDPVLDRT